MGYIFHLLGTAFCRGLIHICCSSVPPRERGLDQITVTVIYIMKKHGNSPVAQKDISGDTTEGVLALVYRSIIVCIDSLISFCLYSKMQLYHANLWAAHQASVLQLYWRTVLWSDDCGQCDQPACFQHTVQKHDCSKLEHVAHVYKFYRSSLFCHPKTLFHSRYCLFEQSNIKITCIHFRVIAF